MLEAEGVEFGLGGAINLERYAWTPRMPAVKKATKRPAKKKAAPKRRSKR